MGVCVGGWVGVGGWVCVSMHVSAHICVVLDNCGSERIEMAMSLRSFKG